MVMYTYLPLLLLIMSPSIAEDHAAACCRLAREYPTPDAIQLWPRPFHMTKTLLDKDKAILFDAFLFKAVGDREQTMRSIAHFENQLKRVCDDDGCDHNGRAMHALDVILKSNPHMDEEEYRLHIKDGIVQIEVKTDYSFTRALTCLFKLVGRDEATGMMSFDASQLDIIDKPKKPWRGLLLDVSRHFMSTSTVIELMNTMHLVNYNILHFHLSDDQGFRLKLKTRPQLASTESYDLSDIRKLMDHAETLGITIVPEFDIPGHSTSWVKAYPSLGACTPNPSSMLNPLDPRVDDLLNDVFEEVSEIFSSKFIHLGGDEVSYNCWRQNPGRCYLCVYTYIHTSFLI